MYLLMRFARLPFVFVCAAAVAACGVAPESPASPTDEAGPYRVGHQRAADYVKPMLPAHALPGERRGGAKADQFDDYRLARPQTYGITAAPQTPLRAVAQWDDHQALLLTWTGSFPEVYAGIVSASQPVIDVYVVHEGNVGKQQFQSAMSQQGVSTGGLQYLNLQNDSIWMRDYGPLSVRAPDGTVAFVDPRYYHQRVFDDALPTEIANAFGITTFRQPLAWEGGTYITDGRGNCIYSQGVYWYGGASEEVIHAYQRDYLGCESNIVVKPLAQEGTTHSDMFSKMYAPGKVLLGEYTGFQDATNKQVLDDNAAILSAATLADGSALEVTRLPMPSNSNKTVWRTYANSLFVNGKNLVPTYSDDTNYEAAALGVWQSIMPDWDHVEIDSTDLITWSGAIHCITMTVPSGALQPVEADPAYLCNGSFDCTPTNTQAGTCAVGYEGCCDGGNLTSCGSDGPTTTACSGGCGWSNATMSYQCGGSGAGPIANAPLQCGTSCIPNCANKTCGSDGCGGSCGSCTGDEVCLGGQCEAPDDPCGGITFQGCCDGNLLKYCDEGLQTTQCNGGCGWQAGQGYYNCGFSGSDPSGQNPKSCPAECTPDCSQKSCGDDGCGGSCGACGAGQTCSGGQCACAPSCGANQCGDDGCGGSCGSCGQGETCNSGQCQGAPPTGCGDVTFEGSCQGNTLIWCEDGQAKEFDCSGLGAFQCGAQPGTDPPNHDCLPTDGCTPSCDGKQCGADGCGGTCGSCPGTESCEAGQCVAPDAGCGDLEWEGCCDGTVLTWCENGQTQTLQCGTSCGWNQNASYYDCNFDADGPAEFPKACGASSCVPQCDGKQCGADGCGGTCGTCTGGADCEAGQCVDPCAGVPFEGACSGDVLHFCNGQGQPQSGDCSEFAACCGWNAQQSYFDCLPAAQCGGCVDACSAGETGCSQAGSHTWTCESVDGCLAPAFSPCPSGACDPATGACTAPQCTPQCSGKACGTDGCGGSCGSCGAGSSCNASGQCVVGCVPSCDGKQCGSDGCGGDCGACVTGTSCVGGQCVESSCHPICDGKVCGDDGCGGSCGECGADLFCDKDGQCADAPAECVPACDGKSCGPDGCGGQCGVCAKEQTCQDGACVAKPNAGCGGVPVTGSCDGGTLSTCVDGAVDERDCAADGLVCGATSGGFDCVEAAACTPNCVGRACGPDGCGGACGDCSKGDTCTNDGQCISDTCTPDCTNRVCGGDGCGGSCGTCESGLACNVGVCEEAQPCAEGAEDCGEDTVKGASDSGGCTHSSRPAGTPAGTPLLLLLFGAALVTWRRRDGQASA